MQKNEEKVKYIKKELELEQKELEQKELEQKELEQKELEPEQEPEEDLDYKINGKTLLLLESLMEYYSKNMNILTSIITQKNTLSLRILDWLVTNYAKKYNVVYLLVKNGTETNFNIYLDYKNQLKAYSKKYFDPFCRRERILINIKDLTWTFLENEKYEKYENKNNNEELITTVGQLNFFKWFIENNVITYAIENIQNIDKDMIDTLNKNKKITKRKELSKSASKTICFYESNTVIKF